MLKEVFQAEEKWYRMNVCPCIMEWRVPEMSTTGVNIEFSLFLSDKWLFKENNAVWGLSHM